MQSQACHSHDRFVSRYATPRHGGGSSSCSLFIVHWLRRSGPHGNGAESANQPSTLTEVASDSLEVLVSRADVHTLNVWELFLFGL